MTLKEAIASSSVGAATFPMVGDIIRFADDTTYWWLPSRNARYVLRDKSLPKNFIESEDWYPYELKEKHEFDPPLPPEYYLGISNSTTMEP